MRGRVFVFTALLGLLPMHAHGLTLTEGTIWPTKTIPICWESPSNRHAQERRLARKAITASWARESAVTFTGWRKCQQNSKGIRIRIGPQHPHTKARGMLVDGVVDGIVLPELWALAALSINVKTPVHEIGHALGFGHEFARAGDEVPEDCRVNRTGSGRYTEDDRPLTSYDPDSIMVGCAGTAQRDLSLGLPLLSAADIYGLVSVYGSAPDNILDMDEADDRFATSLALGDLDGDGKDDLVVGAPGEDGNRGAVYVYRGSHFQGFRPLAQVLPPKTAPSDGVWGSAVAVRPGNNTAGQLIVFGSAEGPGAVFKLDAATGTFVRGDLSPDEPPGPAVGTLLKDVNGDGFPDRISGYPLENWRDVPSGYVSVERGLPDGSFRPWYRFGQAY